MSTNLQRLGKYQLSERLGRGSMAEVWKAVDVQLQRYVAIKLLHADLRTDPDFMNRFIREARVVASLHHPNIVQIHDFQVSEPPESDVTIAYMVMDYIEGQTLDDFIQCTSGTGRFPTAAEIVHLFSALGGAIDYAHQQGMIHRDIKPANIILDKRHSSLYRIGEPMLTDFGIAKLLGTSTANLSGSWLGTPIYIAPEQAKGAPGDERSDLYALGIILYQVCTGVLPFAESNPAALMMHHIATMPTSPELINRNIPPALAAVIMRSIAKDPAARFPSASSLAAALASAFNLPFQDSLNTPNSLMDSKIGSIFYKPLQPEQSSSVTPSLPPSPRSQIALATPQFMSSSSNALRTPITPTGVLMRNDNLAFSPEKPGPTHDTTKSDIPLSTPVKVPPILTPLPPPTSQRRRRRMFIALIALLIGLLAVSSLGALSLALLQNSPAPARGTLVGYAFFVSSGELNESNSQGIEDQLQIDLNNLPDPAAGKSYYAWLLNDEGEKLPQSLFIGRLLVDNGHVNMLYKGDRQYTNLIATYSQFLITEEDAKHVPTTPSLDRHTWRYYAEIPQVASKIGRHFSALIHLRHLLYEGPLLRLLGIHGGSNIQLLRDTQKILEWAASAKEAWRVDPDFIHRQVVRILDYLDSKSYIQQDVPPGTSILVEPILAQVPLITVVKNQNNASLLSRIEDHVVGLSDESQSPGITPARHALAKQTDLGLINEQNWLAQVRLDAKKLVNMTKDQLNQPSALLMLNEMQMLANYAFVGKINPQTNQVQWGAAEIYYSIQKLATFDVKVV
jgi:serine/threonine protein kinase